MKTIDIKSLLIGILATALIMVTVGAVGKPSSEIGRYQIADLTTVGTSILDTSTGKIWASKADGIWVLMCHPVKED